MTRLKPDPSLFQDEQVREWVTAFVDEHAPTIGVPKALPAVLRVVVRTDEHEQNAFNRAVNVAVTIHGAITKTGRVTIVGREIAALPGASDLEPEDQIQLELVPPAEALPEPCGNCGRPRWECACPEFIGREAMLVDALERVPAPASPSEGSGGGSRKAWDIGDTLAVAASIVRNAGHAAIAAQLDDIETWKGLAEIDIKTAAERAERAEGRDGLAELRALRGEIANRVNSAARFANSTPIGSTMFARYEAERQAHAADLESIDRLAATYEDPTTESEGR